MTRARGTLVVQYMCGDTDIPVLVIGRLGGRARIKGSKKFKIGAHGIAPWTCAPKTGI